MYPLGSFLPACSQQGPFLSFYDIVTLWLSLHLASILYYNHLVRVCFPSPDPEFLEVVCPVLVVFALLVQHSVMFMMDQHEV